MPNPKTIDNEKYFALTAEQAAAVHAVLTLNRLAVTDDIRDTLRALAPRLEEWNEGRVEQALDTIEHPTIARMRHTLTQIAAEELQARFAIANDPFAGRAALERIREHIEKLERGE